jgi:hypothetical protein
VDAAALHNFTVAELHTYYVDAGEPVLVHNRGENEAAAFGRTMHKRLKGAVERRGGGCSNGPRN